MYSAFVETSVRYAAPTRQRPLLGYLCLPCGLFAGKARQRSKPARGETRVLARLDRGTRRERDRRSRGAHAPIAAAKPLSFKQGEIVSSWTVRASWILCLCHQVREL